MVGFGQINLSVQYIPSIEINSKDKLHEKNDCSLDEEHNPDNTDNIYECFGNISASSNTSNSKKIHRKMNIVDADVSSHCVGRMTDGLAQETTTFDSTETDTSQYKNLIRRSQSLIDHKSYCNIQPENSGDANSWITNMSDSNDRYRHFTEPLTLVKEEDEFVVRFPSQKASNIKDLISRFQEPQNSNLKWKSNTVEICDGKCDGICDRNNSNFSKELELLLLQKKKVGANISALNNRGNPKFHKEKSRKIDFKKKNDKNPINEELSMKFQENKSNSADEKNFKIPNITLISDNIAYKEPVKTQKNIARSLGDFLKRRPNSDELEKKGKVKYI